MRPWRYLRVCPIFLLSLVSPVRGQGVRERVSTIFRAPHLAKEQAALGTSRRALTGISGDTADDGTLGRANQHIFTRRGPLARSGDIAK